MIAVKSRARYLLAAVAGLGMALPAGAQEPARLSLDRSQAPVVGALDNQQVADGIAQQLRQSPNLRQFNIDISVKGSTVELTGNVGDAKQREQAQKIAMAAPGVSNVVDKLTMGAIQRVSTMQEAPGVLPAVPPPAPLPAQMPQIQQQMPMTLQPQMQSQIPMHAGVPQTVFGEPQGATDAYGPMGGANEMGTPPLPGYAWPTYAPYNNYSRVAYPEAYPACAWPFIGPFYPFPRVPPGWRSVKLEWQDGHWWFSKTATKYDFWRVRYW
jgi:BON domain